MTFLMEIWKKQSMCSQFAAWHYIAVAPLLTSALRDLRKNSNNNVQCSKNMLPANKYYMLYLLFQAETTMMSWKGNWVHKLA